MATPDFQLHRDEWGRLVLVDGQGAEHVGVEPILAFPISEPDHALSFMGANGQEIAYVENLADLPAETRELADDEIRRRNFLPVILKIHSVSSDREPCDWDVETDRGRTVFTLDNEEDVRRLSHFSTIILDASGGRYLVPDTRKLDPASRRVLDQYL